MNEVERAWERARRLYPRSKQLRGVYVNGARASLAGETVERCPYRVEAGKTWRRAFRLAWVRGFESAPPLSEG